MNFQENFQENWHLKPGNFLFQTPTFADFGQKFSHTYVSNFCQKHAKFGKYVQKFLEMFGITKILWFLPQNALI